MSELKILPPTLRERKRYLVFEVLSKNKITLTDLVNAIWHSMIELLGEYGSSNANFWIIKNLWNEQKQIGVIRCSHTETEKVRAALTLIERVNETPVCIKVLGISGTLSSAQKKFFGEKDLMSYA